jgi:hypothetical protein
MTDKFPKMAPLNLRKFDSDDEEEEDKKDDEKMLTLIMKLKSAKMAIDESKKRKLATQVVAESLEDYHKQTQDLLEKHKRKYINARKRFLERQSQLQLNLSELDQVSSTNQLKSIHF